MSSDVISLVEMASRAEPRIKAEPREVDESNVTYTGINPMRTQDDLEDEGNSINLRHFTEAMLRMQERTDERFGRLIEATVANKPNGRSWIAPAAAVFASIVAAVALLMNLTGAQYRSVSETNLIKDVAVLTEKLESSERRQADALRTIERNIALADERNRQLSIVLEARGVKMPQQ